MDFGVATEFHPEEYHFEPRGFQPKKLELDLVKFIQQLHESLDPQTVFACFGNLVGQYLPVIGIKFSFKHHLFNWGTPQGIAIKQQLHRGSNIICIDYYLNDTLMPSESNQLQQLQSLIIQPMINATQYQEMSKQAMYDALTHLGNRHYYDKSINQAVATAKRELGLLSLIVLDLDKFKQLNDRYGHLLGDQVLTHFSNRLSHAIRDTDQAFRTGGDEFVIIVRGDKAAASALCQRIYNLLADEPLLSQYSVNASMGVAQWQKNDSINTLYERADTALYQAKAAGRKCYR